MYLTQSIWCDGVVATHFRPFNGSSVGILFKGRDGSPGVEQTIYFGSTPKARADAAVFFYALGGLEENVALEVGADRIDV